MIAEHWRLVVVIPARDEEALIGRCLDAVHAAVRIAEEPRPWLECEVIVAADRCADATPLIARERGACVVEVDAGSVGAARRAGIDAALADHETPPARTWIASTDADTIVPTDWIATQIDQAIAGAHLTIGRAEPTREDLDEQTWLRWHQAHPAPVSPREDREEDLGYDTPHVHGANLGFRLDLHLAVGGWPLLPEHEDRVHVDALTAAGARSAPAPAVLTSGRRRGRSPGGFAGYLRRLAGADGVDAGEESP